MAPPALRFGLSRSLAWASTWAVTLSIVEVLAISPAVEWSWPSLWLMSWSIPFWCVVGVLLVMLAERCERHGSIWTLLGGFTVLSLVTAALHPLNGKVIMYLTKGHMPLSLDRYLSQAGITLPLPGNYKVLALYEVWGSFFYGALLVATCTLTLRSEHSRHILHRSAMARSRTEELLDTERLQALQQQIDPGLLLDSMQELKLRYRANPESAERLLEALVEFMRCAMHGLHTSVSTVRAELQLARAFAQLQNQRGLGGAWRVIEKPAPDSAELFRFPSLLMLPLLALSGEHGRPLLEVRRDEQRLLLSLNGLSRGVSPDLYQQMQSRLRALYGERFSIDHESLTHQLTITLYHISVTEGANHDRLIHG
jgi:hypothetical protein